MLHLLLLLLLRAELACAQQFYISPRSLYEYYTCSCNTIAFTLCALITIVAPLTNCSVDCTGASALGVPALLAISKSSLASVHIIAAASSHNKPPASSVFVFTTTLTLDAALFTMRRTIVCRSSEICAENVVLSLVVAFELHLSAFGCHVWSMMWWTHPGGWKEVGRYASKYEYVNKEVSPSLNRLMDPLGT
jgi:hypothetical protein